MGKTGLLLGGPEARQEAPGSATRLICEINVITYLKEIKLNP